jgi:hypothetical protein
MGASSNIRGTIASIGQFLAKMPERIAKKLSPRITRRQQEQFTNETDPYGNPWDPLLESTIRRKRGDSRVLRRTNQLQAGSYSIAAGPRVIAIYGPSAVHAQNGQPGVRARRPVAPDKGMPDTWADDVKASIGDTIAEAKL